MSTSSPGPPGSTLEEKARTRAEMELAHAAVAARGAKDAGLRHVVWSTLEDTRPHFERLGSDAPTILGTYKVPHFDAKAEANEFFHRARSADHLPADDLLLRVIHRRWARPSP